MKTHLIAIFCLVSISLMGQKTYAPAWEFPLTENSIQARVRVSVLSSSNGIRPVRRLIASMFIPCSAFSPASIKLVFAEMLPTFFPPFFSMSSLYSSRE